MKKYDLVDYLLAFSSNLEGNVNLKIVDDVIPINKITFAEGDDILIEALNPPSCVRELLDTCYFALEAIRLTREYVGFETLPNIEGWSHYDATQKLTEVIEKYQHLWAENDKGA